MSQVIQCDKCLSLVDDGTETEIWVDVRQWNASATGKVADAEYKLHLCGHCRDKWLRDAIPLMKRKELLCGVDHMSK